MVDDESVNKNPRYYSLTKLLKTLLVPIKLKQRLSECTAEFIIKVFNSIYALLLVKTYFNRKIPQQ